MALALSCPILTLSPQSFLSNEMGKPKPIFAFEAEGDDGISVLLLVLERVCPTWFEPTTRRVSLNDPCWLDLKVPPNTLEDFEPWSEAALSEVCDHNLSAK